MWKKICIGIILLLLVIAGVGYYLFSNLDSLIKSAIENYGSQATQTTVTVAGVTLSLGTGSGTITGVTIANPPGYSTAKALSVGSIAIQLDTSTLTGSGPVVIDSVAITAPQINYEVRGLGQGSNLQTLQNNLQSFVNSGQASTAPAQGTAPGRREIIRDLSMSGGQVTVLAPALNGKTLTRPLPPFHLTNLGGSGGASPAQIGAQIVSTVARQAASAGAAALINHQLGGNVVSPAAGGILKGLFGE
jgi:hypothetical protein